jgi:hypothetical protein
MLQVMSIAQRVSARYIAARGDTMIKMERAVLAQDKLGAKIASESWLRGIAIVADQHGSHFLRVNVEAVSDAVTSAVPAEVDGVPVVVEVVGKLRPLG